MTNMRYGFAVVSVEINFSLRIMGSSMDCKRISKQNTDSNKDLSEMDIAVLYCSKVEIQT